MIRTIKKDNNRDKIKLDFTLEDLRQLRDVCFSSWYRKSFGSDAYKYYDEFVKIIRGSYNMNKITLQFTREEIEKMYGICFSSMDYEPYNSKTYYDAVDFGIYFLKILKGFENGNI